MTPANSARRSGRTQSAGELSPPLSFSGFACASGCKLAPIPLRSFRATKWAPKAARYALRATPSVANATCANPDGLLRDRPAAGTFYYGKKRGRWYGRRESNPGQPFIKRPLLTVELRPQSGELLEKRPCSILPRWSLELRPNHPSGVAGDKPLVGSGVLLRRKDDCREAELAWPCGGSCRDRQPLLSVVGGPAPTASGKGAGDPANERGILRSTNSVVSTDFILTAACDKALLRKHP